MTPPPGTPVAGPGPDHLAASPATRSGPRLWRQFWRPPHPFAEGEDPDAAPGARPLPPQVRPFSRARFTQNVAPFAFGLIFMLFFAIPLAQDPPARGRLVLGIVLAVVFCLQYLGTAVAVDLPLRWRWCYVIVFAVLMTGGLGVAAGGYGLAACTFLTIMIAFLIPWRQARIAMAAWLVIGVVAGIVMTLWLVVVLTVISVGVGMAMGAGMDAGRVERHLHRAERRIATLAVAEERERIARDLHDILGHSLTAITVKAGLAARLAERDIAAARQQMLEVESVARQALSDVRATASGLGSVRLTGEIAGARSVLAAAGIECTSPSAVEPMPDEISEFLGYVVREGVTNIVRHAHARRCAIEVAPGEVRLTDDGIGLTHTGCGGSGLRGLQARAGAVGGVLTISSGAGGGTELTARVPIASIEGAA